jgi:hypothetical protein
MGGGIKSERVRIARPSLCREKKALGRSKFYLPTSAAWRAKLAGGPEQAAARMKLAAAALARGGREFMATMQHLGGLDDARVVALLALNEERRQARP